MRIKSLFPVNIFPYIAFITISPAGDIIVFARSENGIPIDIPYKYKEIIY